MKKLVNYRMYVSVNGGEWKDTSIWNHVRYMEESECETWESRELNFDEALELVEEGFIMNAECDRTFFTHRPRIQLSISESLLEGPSYYNRTYPQNFENQKGISSLHRFNQRCSNITYSREIL